MSVYRIISEIFSVKNSVTSKPDVGGRSRSLKMAPFDRSYTERLFHLSDHIRLSIGWSL